MNSLILMAHSLQQRGFKRLRRCHQLLRHFLLMLIKAQANGVQAILRVVSLLSQVCIQLSDLLLGLILEGCGRCLDGSNPCLQSCQLTRLLLKLGFRGPNN